VTKTGAPLAPFIWVSADEGVDSGVTSMIVRALVLPALALALGGCSTSPPPAQNPATAAPKVVTATSAMAEMYPVKASGVHGLIRFRTTDQGLVVRGSMKGLLAGRYGFGIHEKGDCSAHDGKSVGDYFGAAAGQGTPVGHLEDLLIENAETGDVKRLESKLVIAGPVSESIVGKSLVVEAWPTDPKVDPKTVPYVACGVIRAE
jgi:Cu-Zn family superoxide dismutase